MKLPLVLASACLVTAVATPLAAQKARPVTRLDDPVQGRGTIFDLYDVAGEGAIRAVAWYDRRPNNSHNIFVAVSTDHGLTWDPEVQVTQAVGSTEYGIPDIEVEDGVLHLAYKALGTSSNDGILYERSLDLGQTWIDRRGLFSSVSKHQLRAHGDRVMLVVRRSVGDLSAWWSTDKGANWSLTTQPIQHQASVADFDAAIVPFSGAGVVMFSDDRTGNDNVYLANGTPGAQFWGSLGRVDEDLAEEGDTKRMQLAVVGLDVHMTWVEDGRGGSHTNRGVYYRKYTGGAFEAEQRLGQYGFGTDVTRYPTLVANQNVVAVAWQDNRSSLYHPYIATSQDAGANFMRDVAAPWQPGGVSPKPVALVLDGHKLALGSTEFRNGLEFPSAMMSGDAGSTWSNTVEFELPTETWDEIFLNRDSMDFREGSLVWAWDANDLPEREMRVTGIRFPVVDYEAIPGGSPKGRLHMSFAEPGELARWAASSSLGQVVHPENPALSLNLAPGGIYNQSLAKANALTASIGFDGTAQTGPIPIKPSLIGKTIFIQGWENVNGLGQTPGDWIQVTL